MPLLQQLRRSYHGDGPRDRRHRGGLSLLPCTTILHRQAVDYPLLIGEDSGLAAAEQFGMQTVLPFSVFADAIRVVSWRSRSASCTRMRPSTSWHHADHWPAGLPEPGADQRTRAYSRSD
jgi:hypothetical protein